MVFIEPVRQDKPSVSHFFEIDKEWKFLFKERRVLFQYKDAILPV